MGADTWGVTVMWLWEPEMCLWYKYDEDHCFWMNPKPEHPPTILFGTYDVGSDRLLFPLELN